MRIELKDDDYEVIYSKEFHMLPGDTLNITTNIKEVREHHSWDMRSTGLHKREKSRFDEAMDRYRARGGTGDMPERQDYE